jgi:hypothetical protein
MTAGLWIKEKKSPHESWGLRVITMNTRYTNCRSRQEPTITLHDATARLGCLIGNTFLGFSFLP